MTESSREIIRPNRELQWNAIKSNKQLKSEKGGHKYRNLKIIN